MSCPILLLQHAGWVVYITIGHACACRLGFKRHHHGNMHPFSQDVKNEGANKSNARVARENLEPEVTPTN